MFWRVGLLIAFLFILVFGIFTILFWLAASLLGMIDFPRGGVVFLRGGGIIALVFGVAGLVLAARALRRFTTPIGDLVEAAGRVQEGDYSVRVRENGPRGVRSLAHAFNAMAARLQTNDEQRRNLMADVTHELRTPLTVIQGNLEALLDGIYPRDDAHLAPVLEETRLLSRLIDDLRTLALAETGALVLQREPTDISQLVSETVASFDSQADAAEIKLDAEIAADVPIVPIDPARIREVLENLLANALRYTPRGGTVRVKCFVSDARGDHPLTIAVSDSGAGIAPDDLPNIFERFYKSADSRGTGLGLAIAKNLVAAHGGAISAESEIGRGTTIQFTLPLEV